MINEKSKLILSLEGKIRSKISQKGVTISELSKLLKVPEKYVKNAIEKSDWPLCTSLMFANALKIEVKFCCHDLGNPSVYYGCWS